VRRCSLCKCVGTVVVPRHSCRQAFTSCRSLPYTPLRQKYDDLFASLLHAVCANLSVLPAEYTCRATCWQLVVAIYLPGSMYSGLVLETNLPADDMPRFSRNHRGLRHYWGLRVKGQHTKTTGRRGKTVGVAKKR